MSISECVFFLVIAALPGLALGFDRKRRRQSGSILLPAGVAALTAWAGLSQPALAALSWFWPVQALMWILMLVSLCQWSVDRLQANGSVHTAPALLLSCIYGLACGLEHWPQAFVGAVTITIVLAMAWRRARSVAQNDLDASAPAIGAKSPA